MSFSIRLAVCTRTKRGQLTQGVTLARFAWEARRNRFKGDLDTDVLCRDETKFLFPGAHGGQLSHDSVQYLVAKYTSSAAITGNDGGVECNFVIVFVPPFRTY